MQYKYKGSCLLIIFVFASMFVSAQLGLENLGWRSPVGIPIKLSGNFAELRSDHFHSGIDIKTNGKEGYKVYAVQDGYVSRINVSPTGYGMAIYISHPDGYTSVYCHLSQFNIQIEQYVRNQQYAKEQFDIKLYLGKDDIKIKKGDVIGLTGNSGASGGPHLHFEIRKTATSEPMNGLFLGYDIQDNIPPKMYHLYVYKQDEYSYGNRERIISLKKVNGIYTLYGSDTLLLNGNIGFGLKVNDYLNGSSNRCGVYYIKMYIDGELYFHSQFDKFSFAETRYINSLMDYEQNKTIKRKLHKLFVEPNNKLSLYKQVINDGMYPILDIKVHKVIIETADVKGNTSRLVFYIKKGGKVTSPKHKDGYLISYNKAFNLDSLGITVEMPDNALYDNHFMKVDINTTKNKNYYSNIYNLNSDNIPVHKSYLLKIRCDSVSEELKEKLIIAQLKDGNLSSVGGVYSDGYMKAEIRYFGQFVVVADEIAPLLKPIGDLIKDSMPEKYTRLSFVVYDEFSGISSYRGTINGKWVLFQYDPKFKHLYYDIDDRFPESGEAELKLVVVDGRGNSTVYKKTLYNNSLTDRTKNSSVETTN